MKQLLVCLVLRTIIHLPFAPAVKYPRLRGEFSFADATESASRLPESIPDGSSEDQESNAALEARANYIDHLVLLGEQTLAAHQQTFATLQKQASAAEVRDFSEDPNQYFLMGGSTAPTKVRFGRLEGNARTREMNGRSDNPFNEAGPSSTERIVIVLLELILFGVMHVFNFTAPTFVKNLPWHLIYGICMVAICIVLGILTYLEVYWKIDPETGAIYMNTTGSLFVMEWVAVFLLAPFTIIQYNAHVEAIEKQPSKKHPDVNAASLKQVLGDASCAAEDMGKFSLVLSRAVFNASMVFHAEANLPPRDPDARLNLQTYIVVLFEYLYIFIHLILIFGTTIGFLCVPSNHMSGGTYVKLMKHSLSTITGSSFLQAFPFSHPLKVFDNLTLSKIFSMKTAVTILNIPLAAMALLVKINMLDFITETDYWNWGSMDYVKLLSFVNNLAGMIPDIEKAGIDALLHEYPVAGEIWRARFCESLVKQYGVAGALTKYGNLTVNEVVQILKLKNSDGALKDGSSQPASQPVSQPATSSQPASSQPGAQKDESKTTEGTVHNRVCC